MISLNESICMPNVRSSLVRSLSLIHISVDRISYQIRSMDGQRLVADDEISSFSNKYNTIQADVSMPNVMDEKTEYLLVFTITSGQDNVYYYSRICLLYTSRCV